MHRVNCLPAVCAWLQGCGHTSGLLADGADAALIQLKHERPLAEGIALRNRLHMARQYAAGQRSVQPVHAPCWSISKLSQQIRRSII